MEPIQVQDALVQVLENFQRCGVSRFARASADALPSAALAKIAALTQPQPKAPVAPPPSSASGAPAVERPNPPPSRLAASPPTPSLTDGTVGSTHPWNLPILPVEQRQQRFEALAQQVRDCRKCAGIVTYRQQTVFGDGTLRPTICFMGEAPGADEDRTGKPFVGKAGQLLTKIIAAMKFDRADVYILNALKCRPPQNRTPIPEEIDSCRPFVETQLEILQPQFIVCLGAVAVRSILQSNQSIGRLRGKFHPYRGARVVVTYHPSYLLREESAKKLVWEDMKMLMAELP